MQAREVAEHFGACHHELTASGVDLEEALDAMPGIYDEPFGDHGAWPTFMVSRAARREVTIALTGEGGDELFAGYLSKPAPISSRPRRASSST